MRPVPQGQAERGGPPRIAGGSGGAARAPPVARSAKRVRGGSVGRSSQGNRRRGSGRFRLEWRAYRTRAAPRRLRARSGAAAARVQQGAAAAARSPERVRGRGSGRLGEGGGGGGDARRVRRARSEARATGAGRPDEDGRGRFRITCGGRTRIVEVSGNDQTTLRGGREQPIEPQPLRCERERGRCVSTGRGRWRAVEWDEVRQVW